MNGNDAVYLLTNEPTVAELRQLNRDGIMSFPLPMLLALTEAGVDFETESQATVRQYPHLGDAIEMRYAVRLGGRLIAILGEAGADGFRVIEKRRAAANGRLVDSSGRDVS